MIGTPKIRAAALDALNAQRKMKRDACGNEYPCVEFRYGFRTVLVDELILKMARLEGQIDILVAEVLV